MTMTTTLPLSKPVFIVSLDFELLWGTADRSYRGAFERLCADGLEPGLLGHVARLCAAP